MMGNRKKFSFEEYCNIINDICDCVDGYLYVLDLVNDVYYISKTALERFAISTACIKNFSSEVQEFVFQEDFHIVQEDINKILYEGKREHDIRYRWISRDGVPVWINCRGNVICDDNRKAIFLIGCINEMGLIAKADNVSGLLQSSEMKGVLERELKEDTNGYILRIGIDGFKDVNENFGFQYGDYVLKGVAECIKKNITVTQQVYHVVADEYIILDFNGSNSKNANELYRKIRSSLDLFIEKNNYEAIYTISAGIVECTQMSNLEYGEIMKLSQFALTVAKLNGKNQAYIFRDEDYKDFIRKKMILSELRQSVENKFQGYEVWFQPLISGGKVTPHLYGAESLLRFTLSSGERISPVEFIPILEASGLIIPVGKWVLDRACEFCSEIIKNNPEFKVSVNISYVQILKSALLNEIINTIAKYGLPPANLIVEMTESGYLEDSPAVRRLWNNLKKFGVHIAIDDFGTGYSNLMSVSNFTPNIVKFDRGFTMKALKDSFQNQLMDSIIQLAHALNLSICVEGVETEDELDRLLKMNPDYIQGYYYGKPCPKKEFWNSYVKEFT